MHEPVKKDIRPLIGVSACYRDIGGRWFHAVLDQYARAVVDGAGGQPVLIPGDMGRASWVLVGRPGSMERSFGTTCHGAGRAMSRTAAVKASKGRRIDRELLAEGVVARARSWRGLAEEQPAEAAPARSIASTASSSRPLQRKRLRSGSRIARPTTAERSASSTSTCPIRFPTRRTRL